MGCCNSQPSLTDLSSMPAVKAEMKLYNVRFKKDFGNKYKLGRKLGEGQFGKVYEASPKAGNSKTPRAAKIIWKSKLEDPVLDSIDLISEISVMRALDHVNIVKIYDVFEDETRVVIVEELVTGGELFDHICDMGAYSEKTARGFIRALILGIKHCHDKGITHRDLKPHNILMTDTSDSAIFKICDFGFAKRLGDDGYLRTQLGTSGYKAPELLVDRPCYNEKVDCWSLGVIFFIMLSGGPPFYDDDEGDMNFKAARAKYYFEAEEWDHVSADAKDFIRKILVINPRERLSCAQMLEHKWFKSAAVTDTAMPGFTERLKAFNARRRLKAGIRGVQVALRLRSLGYGSMAHVAASASAGAGGAGAGAGAQSAARPAAPAKAKGGEEERKAEQA